MDQTNQINPAQTTVPAARPKSPKGKLVLQFILALVLPPVGLLLLIYTLIKKRPIKWMGILALIVGIIAGTLIYIELNNIRLTRASQYHYQINNPGTSFAWISNPNGVFKFDKPSEFKQTFDKAQQDAETAIYTHKNSKGYAIGFIGANISSNSQLAGSQTYIDGVKYLMSHPVGDNYDKYVGYFEDFVSGFIGSDYSVKLSQPQPFSNKNITDKAWVFDVSATAPAAKKLAPLQGEFVYIINGKNFYYFSIVTTQDDWQPNAAIWRQILNSLTISQ